MSACDTLCPSKMYILLIVSHQSVQEEWIAGQALRAVLSVSHVTMEGKPARHVGDWGVGGGWGEMCSVISALGSCDKVTILKVIF